jgi:hypothetical protein
MEDIRACSICNTIMAVQSYEDPETKEIIKEHVCFRCGYTEALSEGEEDVSYEV